MVDYCGRDEGEGRVPVDANDQLVGSNGPEDGLVGVDAVLAAVADELLLALKHL